MLQSLSVSNYILIGSLETTFPEGLVIISGETGAGKSILLGALSLALGAKADASMVGPNGDHCTVEAVFGMDDTLREALKAADLPWEDDCLVLRRTVAQSGRSRSFANDEPVSLGTLQDLSALLVDIHSQHQTLKLADERFRLEALDLVAGISQLRERCADAWSRLSEAKKEVSYIQELKTRAEREKDYNTALWERLRDAKLVPGELEDLESAQKQLSHAEELKQLLFGAKELLSPSYDGVSTIQQLKDSARELEKASRYIPSAGELGQRLVSARLEIEDIAAEIEALESRTEVNPAELERVEERLSLLYSLMQKHGAGSVEELITERDRLESLVSDAESIADKESQALKALEAASREHSSLCAELHAKRLASAPELASAVLEHLRALDLGNASFAVEVTDAAPGASGADAVDFLFSAGASSLRPVGKAASGGELSRIMLSLKAVMALHRQMPTLIFDEIDTGVSGSTADKMGSLVCTMGQRMQVFAITHLPQVAAKGNAHYLVSKQAGETSVAALDTDGRVRELARMLSGSTITPEAMANAKRLLECR